MLFAKVAAPQVAHVGLHQVALKRAAESRVTLFTAPAGYVSGDSLAAALNECSRPTLWLRLGPEDADPATLLLSLIAGARRLCPDVGATTLEQMRRQPGPTAGWPPLFARLGHELAEALPASTALVLEHVHHLADAHPNLGLLGAHLLPSLPAGTCCILTTHRQVYTSNWPTYTTHRGAGDLRVDARATSVLFQNAEAGLPTHCIERAVTLTEGRADVLAGLCAAAAKFGPALVQQVIERAADLDDLLFRVACAWLATANTDALQALALAAHLEYSHPLLVQATLGNVRLPAGPLLQALGDDWTRVRCVWKTPLRTALRARGSPSYATLHRMADYLASHDALEQAVPLYCEIGDTASAARAIAQVADTMLSLGQWQTLSNWLDQLTGPARKGTEKPSPWNRLLDAIGLRRGSSGSAVPPESYVATSREMPQDLTGVDRQISLGLATGTGSMPDTGVATPAPAQMSTLTAHLTPGEQAPTEPATMQEPTPTAEALLTTTETTLTPPPAIQAQVIHPTESTAVPIRVPTLTAHLLGTFRVSVNDQPVENWPSGRGRAVFKYLLIHHDQPAPCDVLMDVFWPQAAPESARNSLNVALHRLRRALRIVTDLPVVVFEEGAYCISPEFNISIDMDEFDRHVQAGRRAEAAGQLNAATAEYEDAIGLYQGDLLAGDVYEDWPVLTRERLRVAYLDVLDHLSQIHFSQGQYADCVTLCQLTLARDTGREDVHCLLMRCYTRQGQHHLALRQYQICVDALRAELEVDPALETTQLYERIRHRERV